MKRQAGFLLLLPMLLAAATAQGAGYAVWEMGTKSSAMGGVMTAAPDDPTAIFYNPAGLARLEGQQVTLDLTVINPYTEFSGVAPDPGYGVSEKLADPIFFLPQVYFTKRFNEEFAAGLGFYTPYGLSVEWADPENFSGRRISTFTDLKTYFVSPTVAYTPFEGVSVGLGVNLVWSHVELNRYVVEKIPNPADLGKVAITGSGDLAFSVNVGALVNVTDNSTLGFSYKSKTDLTLTGDADFTTIVENAPIPADGPVETAMPLPSLFSIGVASQVHEKLLVEFNYNRIQWSAFEKLELTFPEAPEADETIREEYENTTQYRFGAEFQASPELALRGGFVIDESPQPTGGVGPVLPDANRKGVSIRAGNSLSNVQLDLYNLFLFMEGREIRDNFDGYNGDYHTYTNLFGLGLTYHF